MTGNLTPLNGNNNKSLTERLAVDLVLKAAGLGVWEIDTVTNLVSLDERCCQLFSVSSNQLVYSDTLHCIYPEDVEQVNQAVQWAMNAQSDGSYQVTYRTIGDDGSTRWIQSTGQRYVDQVGQPDRLAGVAQDITPQEGTRQQAQYLLQQSEARFRTLIEEAPVATCLFVGPEMRIEVANPAMIQVWGKGPDVIGMPLAEALPELKQQHFLTTLDGLFATGDTYQAKAGRADLVIEGKLQTFYFDYDFKPLRTLEGKVYAILETAMDVTEQVMSRQKLEESEGRYRRLSEELERQVQLRTEELAATNEELAAINEELTASNEELTASNEETEATNENLTESNYYLTRSNDNLEKFAYVASHDLQEPLRKIQSFGDLLKERYGGQLGDGADYLERMQLAASRMSTLIRDLLTYSRISTQRDRNKPVPLADVVNQALMSLDLRLQETGAVVRVDPLPTVTGDPSQLAQLFQNLIGNALKFRRLGVLPVIHIRSERVLNKELPLLVKPAKAVMSYHQIEVIDNGVGFDEKYLDRIFEVFQRLYSKRDFEGTGIGLAICEKVAANHGGAITASSQPGQGATFRVYLPA